MKITLSKSQWETIGKKAGWEDGYYKGPLKDGYPPSYFNESGNLEYPWEKNKPSSSGLTDKEKSQKWWSSLSINQMKALTKKYYTNVTWAFVSDTPGLVEDIYQKESKIDMADDISEQKKQLDRGLGRPE